MATYERYELVATVKVGFDNDNLECFIQDLVQLLANYNILCQSDRFKAAVVGDCVEVICLYKPGEVN